MLLNDRSAENTAEKLSEKENMGNGYANFLTNCFVNLLEFVIHFCSIGIFYLNFYEIFGYINLLNNLHKGNSRTSASPNSISPSSSIWTLLSIGFQAFYFCIDI
jgi:hypothetical protein